MQYYKIEKKIAEILSFHQNIAKSLYSFCLGRPALYYSINTILYYSKILYILWAICVLSNGVFFCEWLMIDAILLPHEVVFDSATSLAGLATKLSVFSRSRLSLTQTAKPAKFFCSWLSVRKTSQKGRICKTRFFPHKIVHLVWTLDFFKQYPVFICRANFHLWWPLGLIPVLSGFCLWNACFCY
jgi:hypothetical protein